MARQRMKIGDVFGRLTVIAAERIRGRIMYRCQCQCGKQRVNSSSALRSGIVLSCGCLHREIVTKHGCHTTPTYKSWAAMKSRCYRAHDANFLRYGGSGVTVCDRWRNSFTAFLEDMGERPPGTTIDRINGSGNYEPGNCRWATAIEQSNNTRANRMIVACGECRSVSEWARISGIGIHTLFQRLNKGWQPDVAITTPVMSAAESGRRSGVARRVKAEIR